MNNFEIGSRCRQANWLLRIALLVASLPYSMPLLADDAIQSAPRIDPDGIRGTLVICGGGELPEQVCEKFMQLAGGKSARLVLIPTAASDSGIAKRDKLLAPWSKYSPRAIDVLHTRSRDEANREEFVASLKQSTAVWFGGGQQSRIADAYVGTAVERELMALLQRGGVIGGTSAGAAIQSQLMIASGNPIAQLGVGFDFLPDSVIDQHFSQRDRKSRLTRVLEEHPGHVGFGVDERTAFVVHHRRVEVLGEKKLTICLAASQMRPAKQVELSAGKSADLTSLRRAARDRMQPAFPPRDLKPVAVPNGSLILGGGGSLPTEVIKRFVELAGGPDALIVVLPTASEQLVPDGAGERRMLERAGAKNLVVLPGRSVQEVESEDSLNALKQARGIWFGGGRQWRFVDAYEGTKAVELFHQVLHRGGVIGGSSAGASIQSEYMVRGSPLGNQEMMAEGYERGFGFLPGAAVDQHFSQRNRHPDMKALLDACPQLLGIGLDEGSALLVRGETAEVLGKNSVYFFDRSTDSENDAPTQVPSGKCFHLDSFNRKP